MSIENAVIGDILKVDTQWYINFYEVVRTTKTQIIARHLPDGGNNNFLKSGIKVGHGGSFYKPYATICSLNEYHLYKEKEEIHKWWSEYKSSKFTTDYIKQARDVLIKNGLVK